VVIPLRISRKCLPVILDVKSGKVERVKLPVEIWQKKYSGHLSMILQRKLKASLDPDHVFPIVMKLIMYGLLPKSY
jgi:hypothetical protein